MIGADKLTFENGGNGNNGVNGGSAQGWIATAGEIGGVAKRLMGEIWEGFGADGSYHISAEDNKAKFTLHGEADAHARLSATSTGGTATISLTNDSGLADGDGTTTHWAEIGNRLPYGSFDAADPDVLFYWDARSTSTNQAPNKGVGPITVYGNMQTVSGVAGNGLRNGGTWRYSYIPPANMPTKKGAIGFWYKMNAGASNYSRIIGHNMANWDDSDQLRISTGTSSPYYYIDFVVGNGNAEMLSTENININDGNWHHVVLAWNYATGMRKLRIDGKLTDEDSTAFPEPKITKPIYFLWTDGSSRDVSMDEIYISSDPDQADAPSYYDVVSYTDKSGATISGIPETSEGAIKWNHPIFSPVIQTAEYLPTFTVHDWHPKSISTTTGELVDHLVLDLPLDGRGVNADAKKVYDKVSEAWIGTTTDGVSFGNGVEGNGAEFSDAGDIMAFSTISQANLNAAKGTIEFDYKRTGQPAQYGNFFHEGGDVNVLKMSREMNDNTVSLGIGYSLFYPIYITNAGLYDGDFHHVRIGWDADRDYLALDIDGQNYFRASTSIAAPTFTGNFYIGNYSNNGAMNYQIGGIIDNFRIYNDVILPYGAYYTGYENSGVYTGADGDLNFYWNADSSVTGSGVQIGTGTVTMTGVSTTTGLNRNAIVIDADTDKAYIPTNSTNFNPARGKIGFWFKPGYYTGATTTDNKHIIGDNRSAGNPNEFYVEQSSGYLNFYIYDNATANHSILFTPGYIDDYLIQDRWSFVELLWDDSSPVRDTDYMALKINGVMLVPDYGVVGQSDWSADRYVPYDYGSGDTRFYLGSWSASNAFIAQGSFDQIYITDNPYTSNMPTAFGKPLAAPMLSIVNGSQTTDMAMGTDYSIGGLPDITSWLVRYKTDVSAETTFLIDEGSKGGKGINGGNGGAERSAGVLSVSYASGYSSITVERGDGARGDDFKLIFSEADSGVSSCYLGQGTSSAAAAWGANKCSATSLLTEISQNSVAQESQTGVLELLEANGTEAAVRNTFILAGEATTSEVYHIFADGSVVKDIIYEKTTGNSESQTVNSNFTNYGYHPAEPSATRAAGLYRDSFYLSLTDINPGRMSDFQSETGTRGITGGMGWEGDGWGADVDSDGFDEGRGVYALSANGDEATKSRPAGSNFVALTATPIYHTIGTSTATVNVTVSAVSQISADLWLVKFSGSPDLSAVHKRDRFRDGAATQRNWNIISVSDDYDQVIVGNQEKNSGSPSDLETNQPTVGPWYNSLFTWEAAEDRDLTAATRYANGEIEMAECWPMVEYPTATIDIYGWETAEGNYIKIYTPISQRHRGILDTTKYLIDSNVNGVFGIKVSEHFVVIDGLQFDMSGSNSAGIELQGNFGVSSESGVEISDNIIRGGSAGGCGIFVNDTNLNEIVILNNIIYDFTSSGGCGSGNGAGVWSQANSGQLLSYNNTIYNNTSGLLIYGNLGSVIVKNSILHSNTDNYNACNGSVGSASGYNISNTGDAPGANSKNCTVSFVSTSTKDFHLAANDTCARGAGQAQIDTDFGQISTDIDGQRRGGPASAGFDIGADQAMSRSNGAGGALGAYNFDNRVKFTLDASAQTIYQPRFAISDWYPRTGQAGSAEGYIVIDLPLDGAENTNQVYEKLSGMATGTIASGVTFADGVRGYGAKFDADSEMITVNNVLWGDRITVEFDYKRTEANVNPYAGFMAGSINSSYYNVLQRFGTDNIRFATLDSNDWDFSSGWSNYLSNYRWWHVKLVTDYSNFATLYLNNAAINGVKVGNPRKMTPNALMIGNRDSGAPLGPGGIIDNFKLYNEAILPYGAFYTGYGQNGNYEGRDPSLLFYWDAESALADYPSGLAGVVSYEARLSSEKYINGGKSLNIYNSGSDWYRFDLGSDALFDENKGSVAFWFYSTAAGRNTLLGLEADTDNNLVIEENNSGSNAYIWASWTTDGTAEYISGTAGDLVLNAWNWVKFTWNTDKHEGKVYINGRQSGSTATINGQMSGQFDSVIIGNYASNWASNYYLDSIYITNSPDTPEIPTAFGKPLWMPVMKVWQIEPAEVGGATKLRPYGRDLVAPTAAFGKDYTAAYSSDISTVILQYFGNFSQYDTTLVSPQTGGEYMVEIGDGIGAAQVRRMQGGVRVNGGVRF